LNFGTNRKEKMKEKTAQKKTGKAGGGEAKDEATSTPAVPSAMSRGGDGTEGAEQIEAKCTRAIII